MTTTAPGTHGFHGRQLVIMIGVAAIVLVMAAIGLWLESDTQVSVLAPSDVSTEIVTPEITPYGLHQRSSSNRRGDTLRRRARASPRRRPLPSSTD